MSVIERPRVIHTTSFLSGDGDNTYGWDEKDNSWVIPMIQKKMDEGYVFWIVKRDPLREVRIRTAEEARSVREVIIKEGDARILFEQGRIGIVEQPPGARVGEAVVERRAASAEEAVSNDTVAHPRLRGG